MYEFQDFVTYHQTTTKDIYAGAKARTEFKSEKNPFSLLEHDVYPWSNKNEGIIPDEYTSYLNEEETTRNNEIKDVANQYIEEFNTQRVALDKAEPEKKKDYGKQGYDPNELRGKPTPPDKPVVRETEETGEEEGEEEGVLTVDEIRDYLDEHTKFHYTDEGDLLAVEIHDTLISMKEAEAEGEDTELQQYLQEAHGIDVPSEELDEVPFIGKDIEGKADLYGTLQGETEGEPGGFTRIAYDAEGNVHKRWTPNLAFLSNDNHENITPDHQ